MIPNLETHLREVAHALRQLEAALDRLVEALASHRGNIHIDGARTDAQAVRLACEAYRRIDYDMTDEVNQSPTCLGLIAASRELLARAVVVNARKAEFKAIAQPLYGVRTRVPVKELGEEGQGTKAISVMRFLLRRLQRSDLNLLAAYRRIPILDAPPASVAFTESLTRAVYRKSVADIETLLMTRDSPEASQDRARLTSLPLREKYLALTKEHYRNTRANVVYTTLDRRGRGRVQLAAELPLLYPVGRSNHAPTVTFPSGSDERAGRRPRASKLEPTPFLRTLPVYRYRR